MAIPDAKRNQYDLRKSCSDEARQRLCYDELGDMEAFLNLPHVQAQIGVDPGTTFKMCDVRIRMGYAAQGGGMRGSTARLLPALIDGGVRVLAYAGTADAVCNFMGVEALVGALPTAYAREFAGATPQAWTVGNRTAGYVRAAGGSGATAGNQTFVAVYEAGSVSRG
jgi:cathepsin A (carboxypeptidase C)